jgi:hypothetical protein
MADGDRTGRGTRPRLSIVEFVEVQEPIRDYVTKFGGQPVWIAEPIWPISPRLGSPMQFVAQILLPEPIVGRRLAGKMAYFFLTEGDDSRGSYFCGGSMGDGESAVIVQPGPRPSCRTVPNSTGPTLYSHFRRGPGTHEFLPLLEPGTDPELVPEEEIWGWNDLDNPDAAWPEDQRLAYYDAVSGTKIGGTPGFIQNDD